jgi:hypothetical protein
MNPADPVISAAPAPRRAAFARSTMGRALVLFAILAVECAGFELALRASGFEGSASFRKLFLQDPRVGYRLTPGVQIRYTTPEFSTQISINEQGDRDDQPIGPKRPDERRIVVLGDSLVFSVQVALSQTFCKRLEHRLAEADPSHTWRVIDAGVQGYGPVQEWLFYREVVQALEPDLVLIVPFTGNDAIEANDNEGTLDHGPSDAPPVTAGLNAVRRLTREWAVLQVMRLRVQQVRDQFRQPGIERPLSAFVVPPSAEATHGVKVAARAYDLIAQHARERGARTAIAIMPARFQVDDNDYHALVERVALAGRTLDRDAGTEQFRAALTPLGLPLVDLLPALRSHVTDGPLFFRRNVHLTVRGHQIVGDALFEFVKQAGLIGSPA